MDDPLLIKLERWQARTVKKCIDSKIFVPETSTQAETETILDDIDGVKGITDFCAPFTQITSKIGTREISENFSGQILRPEKA